MKFANKARTVIGALAVCMVTISSCVKVNIGDTIDGGGNNGGDDNTVITGTIDKDLSLPKGKYTLRGYVYVNNGATLTIAKGSVIVGAVNANEKAALIIERGSQLIADGTAEEPIIFTSGNPVGSRAQGDWGGIILLGRATTNRPAVPAPIIEGGVNRPYGGTVNDDNSGILRYVRIEFTGVAAEPGSEINGLTCGGVGSKTILENIQCSYGADDAYEFFGGTVNAKNLIAFATYDDDYDFDFGYNGKIQYAVSLRDKPSDIDQANGIECDNDGSGTSATPYTKPVLSNLTLIGPYDATGASSFHGYSMRWRRATRFVVRNSVFLAHIKAGFSIESNSSANDYYNTNQSEFKNNFIGVVTKPYLLDSVASRAIATGFAADPLSPADRTAMFADALAKMEAKAIADGNTTGTRDDAQLTDPFSLNAPNFLPKAGSPVLAGANFTGLDAFFNNTITFRGAFGTTNWAAGWASFTPKTNVY